MVGHQVATNLTTYTGYLGVIATGIVIYIPLGIVEVQQALRIQIVCRLVTQSNSCSTSVPRECGTWGRRTADNGHIRVLAHNSIVRSQQHLDTSAHMLSDRS